MAAQLQRTLLTPWPWISLLFLALAPINPLGFELVRNTMHGDPWASAIAGPILLSVLAVLGLLALAKCGVRTALNRRRIARAAESE
jgi:membrane protein YdbS with pleckstrin-like domain